MRNLYLGKIILITARGKVFNKQLIIKPFKLFTGEDTKSMVVKI
jgi:hypothetical protein